MHERAWGSMSGSGKEKFQTLMCFAHLVRNSSNGVLHCKINSDFFCSVLDKESAESSDRLLGGGLGVNDLLGTAGRVRRGRLEAGLRRKP